MERLVTSAMEKQHRMNWENESKKKFKKERRTRKRPARPPVFLSLLLPFLLTDGLREVGVQGFGV